MAIDITAILQRAVEEGASDVILTAGVQPVVYIDGKLLRLGADKLTGEDTQRMLYSVLEGDQAARFERDRELDFSFTYDGQHRFRGNVFYQRGAVGGALRLITNAIPAPEALGLPPVAVEFVEAAQGLVLVTGPTGHGKSTTLASLIDHVNRTRACHIVTIEDPIEFVHHHRMALVEQREVGTDTHSFADAVRHVLRQAPHVIQVGEMRDLETIRAVLTAAETGHLVLATLHTNDAAQTVDRIIDVFPPNQQNQVRMQLSMALSAILSQRLLPRLGGGRVLACEVLRGCTPIANLIREGKTAQVPGMIETHAKLGMQTLDAAVKRLYLDGIVAEDAARAVMRHPGNLFG